jgi:Na+-transporting methylmalonyl-CoA/oxaloacetate decarboxylase beta subunit
MNPYLKNRLIGMIGTAGILAVTTSARVVQGIGQQANPRNFLIIHGIEPNIDVLKVGQ